jgi:hypothetical protein
VAFFSRELEQLGVRTTVPPLRALAYLLARHLTTRPFP